MLAGCATRGGGGGNQGGGDTGSSSSGGSGSGDSGGGGGGGVTIDFASFLSEGEPGASWYKEMIAEYEQVSGNTVKISYNGRDVLTKIKTRILTGDPPDIVEQDGSEISAALLSSEILCEPLNGLLDSPGLDGEAKLREAFNNEILNMYAKDGTVYFVPYTFITSGFFYDKTMFKNMGVSVPKNWDEFIAAGETFKAAGIPFLALDGNISFYNAYYFYWACQRVMGTGNFYRAATDATGAAWDEPGYLQAAEMVHELSKGGRNFFQEGYAGSAYPQAQSDWAMGNMGSVLCGTWIPVETRDLVADDWEYGFFTFPEVVGGAGDPKETEAYLIGWAIPKGAKNVEAAQDFITFMSQKKSGEVLVGYTDGMSSRLDVPPPAVLADVQPYLAASTGMFLSYDGVQNGAPEWWADVFYNYNDQLVFGQITAPEFIKQIKQATIDFYKNKG
jgi:raffinose/stachyose/melibiose transport system substrate-binding protein